MIDYRNDDERTVLNETDYRKNFILNSVNGWRVCCAGICFTTGVP